MPDPKTLNQQIIERAENVLGYATTLRSDFEDEVGIGRPLTPFLLRPVMDAEAEAQPWQQVLRKIDSGIDPLEAVRAVREDATVALLETAPKQSTCPLSDAADHIRREGLRSFLRSSRRFVA